MLSISDTTTLFIHHTFLYIPLPLLHDYDVKVPYWSRFLEDVNKGKRLPFSFPEFSIQCLRIHPWKNCKTFVRIERDGISATNWLKTGGFFSLQSVFGWSRAHFSWMGGDGGGGGGKLEEGAKTATSHRNTYKHHAEEHKKTENRTGITQQFLNTAKRLVL